MTWLSLRVTARAGRAGGRVASRRVADAGLDAWLTALEVTASPNVLLPRSLDQLRADRQLRARGLAACGRRSSRGVAGETPEDVVASLEEQGLALEAELPVAPRYLIWSWPAAEARADDAHAADRRWDPRRSRCCPASPFPLLVSSVTRGAMALPAELLQPRAAVTFVAGGASW